MKYFLFTALILIIILSGCAVLASKHPEMSAQRGDEKGGNVLDDVYEGTGQGYRGPIHVQVRLNGGYITEIIIVDSIEDSFVGGAAMDELADIVIEYNTTDVDAVSGATQSSRGFLEAVENAILKL